MDSAHMGGRARAQRRRETRNPTRGPCAPRRASLRSGHGDRRRAEPERAGGPRGAEPKKGIGRGPCGFSDPVSRVGDAHPGRLCFPPAPGEDPIQETGPELLRRADAASPLPERPCSFPVTLGRVAQTHVSKVTATTPCLLRPPGA